MIAEFILLGILIAIAVPFFFYRLYQFGKLLVDNQTSLKESLSLSLFFSPVGAIIILIEWFNKGTSLTEDIVLTIAILIIYMIPILITLVAIKIRPKHKSVS